MSGIAVKVTIPDGVLQNLDSDVAQHLGPAGAQLEEYLTKVEEVQSADVQLEVLAFRFEPGQDSGTSAMKLTGLVNGKPIEDSFETTIAPKSRNSPGGTLIASVVSNVAHRGAEGIRTVAIESAVAGAVSRFTDTVNKLAGVAEPEIRKRMRLAGRWWLYTYAIAFVICAAITYYYASNKPKPDSLTDIVGLAFLAGGIISAFPACAAAAIQMLFIPANQIAEDPAGVNLMTMVGLKSPSGVKTFFVIVLVASIAATVVLAILSFNKMGWI